MNLYQTIWFHFVQMCKKINRDQLIKINKIKMYNLSCKFAQKDHFGKLCIKHNNK